MPSEQLSAPDLFVIARFGPKNARARPGEAETKRVCFPSLDLAAFHINLPNEIELIA